MKKISILAFNFVLAAQTAFSESSTLNNNIECPTQGSSQSIYECSKDKAKNSDRALNEEYNNVKQRISLNYKGEPQLKEEILIELNKSQKTG